MNTAPRLAWTKTTSGIRSPKRAWIILGLALATAALIYGPTLYGLWRLGGFS